MATPLRKCKPGWLDVHCDHSRKLNKNYCRSIKYYRKLFMAWPDWCEYHPDFKKIYDECRLRRAAGEAVSVDHIVPIFSDIVSGLHVPWNLQIITTKANAIKSNKWWPDHLFENLDLFYDL